MKKLTLVFVFLLVAWFGVQQALADINTPQNVVPCVPTTIQPCTNLAPSLEGSLPEILNPTVLIKKPLKLGATGLAVKALQQILHDKGYLKGPIDGKFGLNTKNAIIEIQKLMGLKKIDGIVGPETMISIQKSEEKEETIEIISKKSSNKLFKDYACKESTEGKLSIWTGETYDKAQEYLYRLSDVWSTTDGINWEKEANTTKMGEGSERMIVKVKDTIYSFGGKYKPTGGESDTAIYKSTDMVNWTYVGETPNFSRYFDKSAIYFGGKFWIISSEETTGGGVMGIWNSSTGEKWTKVADAPWDGLKKNSVSNEKSGYDSNSLGAYVIGNKMFYLVYDRGTMTIFSSSDGKKWTNEGALVNSKDNSDFNIGTNTNPSPVVYNGKVWIMSTIVGTSDPIVINTSNGKSWNLVSSSKTNFVPGYYSSDVVFKNKLWKIGGMNNASSNDNTIYSSSDGIEWEKMEVKGVSGFPGPADRYLAGAMSMENIKTKATDLKIEREYNATSFFTGNDEKGTTLGKWKLYAESGKNTKNTGDIIISTLSFLGTDYKSSLGNEFSTLESLSNIKIYINDVEVGSISKFGGPFYDKSGKTALPQTIILDKPYTIKNGENVWVKLTADFPAPKFKNYEMRTWLAGVGFSNAYNTPCSVYTDDTSGGFDKSPGRTIYYNR
ncbi:peptidoglycan-binding protein [Candidatus Nomurabacteria bacterium]|nr:peptidoglycan-binding protein [Candidatus Nomurabacteria bacterium]